MTRKLTTPCPGCGKIVYRQRADKVCGDCAHAIEQWPKHIEALKADETLGTVRLQGAAHWYPLFYNSAQSHSIDGLNETRDEVGSLFHRLVNLLVHETIEWPDSRGIPEIPVIFERQDIRYPLKRGASYAEPARYPTSDGAGRNSNTVYAKMRADLIPVIRDLWDRCARFSEMCYLAGLQDGRNLLFQMSAGELSAADLAEADARIARKVQDSALLHKKLGTKR